MSTVVDRETAWIQALSSADRARFFAVLSHNLTVVVRVLCHCGENEAQALEWARGANEAHHRVTSYLSHILAGDEDPGWLPVVAAIVLEEPAPAVRQQLEQAWAQSKGTIGEAKV